MITTEVLQSQLNKSRKDKFLLVLTLPAALKQLNTSGLTTRQKNAISLDTIQFSVYGDVLPTVEVPAVVATYGNQSYKLSSHTRPVYEDITVNFTVDNKFNNYWVIYKWLDILNDDFRAYHDAKEVTDGKIEPLNYQANFTLYALDEFDKPVAKFIYTRAFPISLAGINYSYRDAGEMETNFTFAFSQFLADLV